MSLKELLLTTTFLVVLSALLLGFASNTPNKADDEVAYKVAQEVFEIVKKLRLSNENSA